MSLEPLSKSLGTVIDERLSSPLISSFVLAWSLWNYKIFFVLFSSRSLEYKFDTVEAHFAGMNLLVNGFGLPLIAAIIYLYWLPIPAQLVYDQWRENQRKTDDIRIKHELKERLTSEQSNAIKQREFDAQTKADKADETILALRSRVDSLQEKSDELDTVKSQLQTATAQVEAIQQQLESRRELQADLELKYDQALQAKHQFATDLRLKMARTLTKIEGITSDLMNSSSYAKLQSELIDAVGGPRLLTPQMMKIISDAISTLRKRHHVEFLEARAKLEALLTELPDSVVGTSTTLEIQDLQVPTILNGSKAPSTPAS